MIMPREQPSESSQEGSRTRRRGIIRQSALPVHCRARQCTGCWQRSSTAPHDDRADTIFEVIHPHHPLRGQKFKLVTYRHNWGEDRVYFHDVTGRLSSLPACWTTVSAEDPFVVRASGRCFFRYEDLIKLVELVEKLR